MNFHLSRSLLLVIAVPITVFASSALAGERSSKLSEWQTKEDYDDATIDESVGALERAKEHWFRIVAVSDATNRHNLMAKHKLCLYVSMYCTKASEEPFRAPAGE